MNLDQNTLMEETQKIITAADEAHATLRLLGSVAFRLHCPKFTAFSESMKRELIHDIDLVCRSDQCNTLTKIFSKLNYGMDEQTLLISGGTRFYYKKINNGCVVDVFVDKLEMCHTIDLRKRLEVDYPTISAADLLLEKMQIVKINERDIKDAIVLLMEHELGSDDRDTINLPYITRLLGQDWGFYYTVASNLQKVKQLLPLYAEALPSEQMVKVEAKIDNLLQAMENEPKTLAWKIRARVGTSRQWYRDVDELNRVAF